MPIHRRWFLLCALVIAGCGQGGDPRPSSTTTTVVSTTTTTSEAPTAVDTTAALLRPGDLPGDGWMITERAIAEVDPAAGFCGEFVSVRELDVIRTRPFARAEEEFVVSGLLTFTSEAAAATYLDDVLATTACGTWTDPAGLPNQIQRVARSAAAAGIDGVRGLVQTIRLGEAAVRVDITYLRRDRAISFITHTAAVTGAGDTAPAESIGGLLAEAAAVRLAAAVAT